MKKLSGEKRSIGAKIGSIFKLNVNRLTKIFYFSTVGAVIMGVATYMIIMSIWHPVLETNQTTLPQLITLQNLQREVEGVAPEIAKILNMTDAEEIAREVEVLGEKNDTFNRALGAVFATLTRESDKGMRDLINDTGDNYLKVFVAENPSYEDAEQRLNDLRSMLEGISSYAVNKMSEDFVKTEKSKNMALIMTIILFVLAFSGLIVAAIVLSGVIEKPIMKVNDDLALNSQDMAGVTGEIGEGARMQTKVVATAIQDLEDMIINIIQGSISLSVDKQSEISLVFADFLKQFVERTAAEIAMGMMSVSQQSEEAREDIGKFITEMGVVEENIKDQEGAIDSMVAALKIIVTANEDIKGKAVSSNEAADVATDRARQGEERMGVITKELQEIKVSSEGVGEITESLAKITENIKILALNMSLKVEDIRDDTGKSYGFEAMSARVQELAEEVEGLLVSSREIIRPTIEAIGSVSVDATEAGKLLADVTETIQVADAESKAISLQIDKQTIEIDRIEKAAENLKNLAHQSTETITAQAEMARGVNETLQESSVLIETVSEQTKEASDGARKVNDIMVELKETMNNIEDGTGKLTEKSMELSDLFISIQEQAEQNLVGVEKLETATRSVEEVTNTLSVVVTGKGTGSANGAASAKTEASDGDEDASDDDASTAAETQEVAQA